MTVLTDSLKNESVSEASREGNLCLHLSTDWNDKLRRPCLLELLNELKFHRVILAPTREWM